MTVLPPSDKDHYEVSSLSDDETSSIDQHDALSSALRTLDYEIEGLQEMRALLNNGHDSGLDNGLDSGLGALFSAAVQLIHGSNGRVIISGIGKSGHIGQKIAATFASTGTPAFFVHPSEASHGDLGMITKDDIILALSWSGETTELTNIINYARRFRVPLISITSSSKSALARNSDVALLLPRVKEACPHGLAPTSSTIMQLAIGDALAIALLEAKGFSATDFKTFHPGGQLGAGLKLVKELMHGGARLPLVKADKLMSEALVIMTEKSFGCIGVVDGDGKLIGVITDGDLRRNMDSTLLLKSVSEIMKQDPITIHEKMLASAALEQINSSNITALFVLSDEKPIGILHIHDLLRAGVA